MRGVGEPHIQTTHVIRSDLAVRERQCVGAVCAVWGVGGVRHFFVFVDHMVCAPEILIASGQATKTSGHDETGAEEAGLKETMRAHVHST